MGTISVAIADDNERMVEILDSIVKKDSDLRIVGKANNGEDVYHMIKEKEPDVVLLDLIMPKMDGLSVMERINQDRSIKKHPKFIVISAIGQEGITEDAFNLGAYYYIMKPFDNEIVLNTYTAKQWETLETIGIVFLPFAGKRDVTTTEQIGDSGYYWTSDNDPTTLLRSYGLLISNTKINITQPISKQTGCAIRLVNNIK